MWGGVGVWGWSVRGGVGVWGWSESVGVECEGWECEGGGVVRCRRWPQSSLLVQRRLAVYLVKSISSTLVLEVM